MRDVSIDESSVHTALGNHWFSQKPTSCSDDKTKVMTVLMRQGRGH